MEVADYHLSESGKIHLTKVVMKISLLSRSQVEKQVGMRKSKLYALIKAGTFPGPIKIGGSSRWPSSDVEEWIATQISLHRELST